MALDAVRLEPVALAAELTPEGLRLLGLLVEGFSLGEAAVVADLLMQRTKTHTK